MADHRSQPVPQRQTLVHGNRQTPGRAEGLSRAQEGERGADAVNGRRRTERQRTETQNASTLVGPRSFGGRLAQLARAPALHAGCRRFESVTAHHPIFTYLKLCAFFEKSPTRI